jgi:hypothetical protein
MSIDGQDNQNPLTPEFVPPANVVEEQAPAILPADEPAAAPVARAGYADVQNAKNTPMQDLVEPASMIIRDLTEEEQRSGGFLTIFLGNDKKSVLAAHAVVKRWLEVQGVRSLVKDGRARETMLNKAEADWADYVAAEHPDRTPQEVSEHAAELYRFMSEVQDELKVRSRVMNEHGVTNQHNRGNNFVTSDVVGKKPGANLKGLSPSEIMRRTALKNANDKLAFDVLMRDSFVYLTFARPSKMEMGTLVNDLRMTIKGYVRQLNNNSATIARIAAMRVMWDFIVKRISNSSVSDIGDFGQLANAITITDFDALGIALIESYNTKGVNMNLRCLGETCDWNNFSLVDPSKLIHDRTSIQTPEEAAAYGNLFNGKAKYTVAESRALSTGTLFGLETNRVYNADKSLYLEIAPPTLAQAFDTFDYFAGKINPQLADIRQKVLDPEEYEAQVTMAHNDLGATEFIHWVSAYGVVPAPGSEEEPVIIRREDVDAYEFNKGIMEVIQDHSDLNAALTGFILNKTPYMSRTFCGVQNYVCPKCHGHSGDLQDPKGHLDRKLGYTPIDPIMSFFILTQLKMMAQALEQDKARSAALSE